jgi:hypothetical protein
VQRARRNAQHVCNLPAYGVGLALRLPCDRDGLPLTELEHAAAGDPCLAPQKLGAPEIQPKKLEKSGYKTIARVNAKRYHIEQRGRSSPQRAAHDE